MRPITRLVLAALAALVVAGCSGNFVVDRKFYDTPIEVSAAEVDTWYDRAVIVWVNRNLTVSDDPDVYFPGTQIDWWEDPPGDRHAQVEDIMHTALHDGVRYLDGPRPVVFVAKVELFHALTPRSRERGFFGWHDITYTVTAHDAHDGTILAGPQRLYADRKAFQRDRAKAAEAQGITQRVRISEQVARSIRAWLESGAVTAE